MGESVLVRSVACGVTPSTLLRRVYQRLCSRRREELEERRDRWRVCIERWEEVTALASVSLSFLSRSVTRKALEASAATEESIWF